jgi:hypothetical protein
MRQTTERIFQRDPSRAPRIGLTFLTGVVVGATLTYLLEPRTRLRRQAFLRDKTASFAHHSFTIGSKVARHTRNRLQGLIAITSDLFRPTGIESDQKIEARVRSILGRTTRHAHSISVSVERGNVSLRGSLAPHEAGEVIRAAERIKGVKKVENLLTPPAEMGHSPIQ